MDQHQQDKTERSLIKQPTSSHIMSRQDKDQAKRVCLAHSGQQQEQTTIPLVARLVNHEPHQDEPYRATAAAAGSSHHFNCDDDLEFRISAIRSCRCRQQQQQPRLSLRTPTSSRPHRRGNLLQATMRLTLASALICLALIPLLFSAHEAALIRSRRQTDSAASETATPPPPPEVVNGSGSSTSEPPTSSTAAPFDSSNTSERPKSKIPPINYTQVDELFNEVLEEDQVLAKWHKMDRVMTDGVRAALKIIFPHVVAMSSEAKVSGACSGAILKWILNLRNMRTWAVKMLDATGKPAAGLLEGSLTMFGNYRECLRIRAPDEDEIEIVEEFREYFRGQYCVLQLKPYTPKKPQFYSLNSTIRSLQRKSYKYYEKNVYDDLAELAMAFNFVNIRADLCVPSLCSRDDIQRVADFLSKKVDMRARVQRCDVMPMEGEPIVDDSQVGWSLAFLLLLLLVVASTLLSAILRIRERSSKTRTHSLLTSMSIYKSLSHMGDVQLDRINNTKPAFLYTLRLIVVAWICLTSLTSQLDFQYLRELLQLRDLIMLWPLQLIVNSSLQFDSLILLTAFTYSYQNINSNLKDLVKYNIGKYSRLMPSIMFMVALTIVTPLIHKNLSPVWHDFVDQPAQVCKSNGLINIFFLQNLLKYEQICLPQTWIFCVELQLCLLAIPIVYLMNKNFDMNHGRFRLASMPIVALIMVTLIGVLVNFMNIYQNSLPAAWFETYPDKEDKNLYFSLHLTKTWTHLISFAVGLFAGHLTRCQSIATFSGRPYGRKCCNSLMLITSTLLMTTIIYSTYSWSISGQSHLESPIWSALYGSLAPLFWSISWSLILFYLTVPDEKDQRPSLASLLTFDQNLIRLGRLTFLAYLINPYVNNFIYAIQEQPIFSSILMLGHTLIGNLVITFALAIVVSAAIELPCRRLIKKLALGSKRQSTNLGIITRQLNIHHENQIPTRDIFNAQQMKNHNLQQPMIPLK